MNNLPDSSEKRSAETPPELRLVRDWLRNQLTLVESELRSIINPDPTIKRVVAELEEKDNALSAVDGDAAHAEEVGYVSETVRSKQVIQAVNAAFDKGDYDKVLSYLVDRLEALAIVRGSVPSRAQNDYIERNTLETQHAHDTLKAYMDRKI